MKIFILICSILLLITSVSADMDIFDNLNGTGYNATFKNFFGDFIGNGSQLNGLTESQIIDLQHTADTNRSDAEINTLIDNRVIQSFIEALGFFTGAHTIDTNRSDADILSVASVYNDTDWVLNQSYLTSETDPIFTSENSSIWSAINNKLESTDQKYNDTNFIEAVNTTSNIEGLGFVTGSHTTDTNRTDTEINTLIDNRVVQAFIEALGFFTGAHTVDTNRSNEDILNVTSVYNDTVAINTKLDATDQRYNETDILNSVNTTANIESLGFVQGVHTTDTNRSDSDILSIASVYNETNLINSVNTTSNIEGLGFTQGAHTTDTNRSDSEINTLIDNRVIQSFIETLGFVIGAHTIDTNRSDADILSVANVYNDTSRINAINTTSNIEGLGFVQGQHTTDTNRSDSDILSVASVYNNTNFILNQNYQNATQVNNSIIAKITQAFVEALGFVIGEHTVDTNRSDADILNVASVFNETDLINSVNTTSNIESLGFTQGQHTVDTNRSDADIISVASIYNETDWVIAQNYLISETDPNLWTSGFNSTGDSRWLDDTTIGNCSEEGSCSLITYDSELNYTVDTNETTRFGNLVDVDCSGTDKVIGVQTNGTVLCGTDQTGGGGTGKAGVGPYLYNDTDEMFFNETFLNGTIDNRDQFQTDAEVNTLIDNKVIQSYIEALGFATGAHTIDTNRSDTDILSVSSVYNETNWVVAQNYLTSESDPSLWTSIFNSTGDNRWLDDTTIGNCSGDGSCSLITYDSETSSWDKNEGDDFDGVWSSLTSVPSGFSDDVDNDTTYTHLSNFTDNIGVSSDWDEIGDVPTATPSNGDTANLSTADQIYDWVIGLGYITDGNTNWDNSYGFITNSVSDLVNYYLKSEVYNKTEIDTQGEMETIWGVTLSTDSERTSGLAAQDACSEISGCVVGAITDGNTNWDNSYGFITSTNVAYTNKSNTFSGEQFFNAGINITQDQNISIGACQETWNGTCLNTYCQGTLIQSIGCA